MYMESWFVGYEIDLKFLASHLVALLEASYLEKK